MNANAKKLQIVVKIKNVYGRETVYPVCDKAKLLAEIAGTTTLTPDVLLKIKALGYKITETVSVRLREVL